MAVQRAYFVIDKINADTFCTHHLRVPVPLARCCKDTFLHRCAPHIPQPHRAWQHTVTVAGTVCRDSLFVRIHYRSTVPPEPHPHDIHHVHSRIRDTLRRPAGSQGTVAHVPHNLCIALHHRTRKILHRRYFQKDVFCIKIRTGEPQCGSPVMFCFLISTLQESS